MLSWRFVTTLAVLVCHRQGPTTRGAASALAAPECRRRQQTTTRRVDGSPLFAAGAHRHRNPKSHGRRLCGGGVFASRRGLEGSASKRCFASVLLRAASPVEPADDDGARDDGAQQKPRFERSEEARPLRAVALIKRRLSAARPRGDALDRLIVRTAVPSMANLAVVPLVGAVDTFWVGRMGDPLAQAGQSAAGTTFFAAYFLASFVPTVTAPLVAAAVGAGDTRAAEKRVGEAMWVSCALGAVGTLILVSSPGAACFFVLPRGAPALPYARRYLRCRATSMVPALVSAVGFAAYRGLLDTVTPLKVSLLANGVNLVLDPLLIFPPVGLGVAGAAVATAVAESASAVCYVGLLTRQKLLRLKKLVADGPPSLASLAPLVKSGLTVLARQCLLNLSFLLSTRRAQAIDPTGVSAAAYGVVMQIFSLGIVVQLAIQGAAAALVPTTRATQGDVEAAKVVDRLFVFGIFVAMGVSAGQLLFLPWYAPLFSTVPAVRDAIKAPATVSALVQLTNGIIFAGEGAMMGVGAFGALACVTAVGVSSMAAVLATPLARRLDGILLSILAFHVVQAIGVLVHHLNFSPLASRRLRGGGGVSSSS